MIDLTMIGDFSYYTGMTFEGYAAELGFPVCSGGRYDNLLQQFGRPAPATGFALKTNRILDGVDGIEFSPQLPVLLQYDAANRKEALAEARRLREAGRSVMMRHVDRPEDLVSSTETSVGPLGPSYGETISFISSI
ncbi:ATP phosphoribosyltransferase regulatory subunit [compost metagenome]